jgi:hypothetical protein
MSSISYNLFNTEFCTGAFSAKETMLPRNIMSYLLNSWKYLWSCLLQIFEMLISYLLDSTEMLTRIWKKYHTYIRFKMGSHSGSFLSYLGHLCVNILRMFDISFSFKWLTECPSQYWACMSMWSPQSLLHERALSTCKFVATFSHCKKRSRDTKKEKSGIDLLKCLLWDCNINEFIIIYWMLWIGVLVLL